MSEKKTNTGMRQISRCSKLFVIGMTLLYAISVSVVFVKKDDSYSQSERRQLASRPEFETEDFWSGKYVSKLENYMVDQFPLRDALRSVKSNFFIKIMHKQDTHGIYVKDGYLCEMEYPMDEKSVSRAAKLFENIYDKYLKGTEAKSYISVVPDKNYFLADNGVLAMDYERFYSQIYEKTPHFTPILIKEQLLLSDYYRTDTHWKQEEILDVAEELAESMGVPFKNDFTINNTDTPFYGVYYGQAGLDLPPDTISYCTSDAISDCYVFDYENNKEIALYNLESLSGRDPYEMFLGGNISLVTIENPKSLSDKELVVFGDSFSRSLLPLLAGSYHKITLVDIRYMSSVQVGNYIDFANQDVLFLYSTSVLNNSITLK